MGVGETDLNVLVVFALVFVLEVGIEETGLEVLVVFALLVLLVVGLPLTLTMRARHVARR